MQPLRSRRESSRPWRASTIALAIGLMVVSGSRAARADNGVPPPTPSPAPAAPPATAPPPPPPYPPPPPPQAPGASREDSNRPLVISDWPEDEPAPQGYHWSKRVRRGPIIAGAVLFGTFYVLSAFIGALGQDSGDPAYGWLYVPGLGPFIELSNSSSATASVALILDGAAQSAGLALLVWGIVSPAPVLVRNQIDAPRVVPVPMLLGRNGQGFGLIGTF